MNVRVTSPSPNQTVGGSVKISATASQTSLTDGGIAFWGIYDGSSLVWTDINPDPSINLTLALSPGPHTLKISAYDNGYKASTATVPVESSSNGKVVSWRACMYTQQGQQYQAMQMQSSVPITGVIQSEMFNGSNCDPVQWTDQLNDYGTSISLGGGFGYTYYFIHRANQPNVSAVWTIGNQSSGCVNYAKVPAC
jgi:hypothetical protein